MFNLNVGHKIRRLIETYTVLFCQEQWLLRKNRRILIPESVLPTLWVNVWFSSVFSELDLILAPTVDSSDLI
ncbi:hypothetical protein L596_009422 [Steinernema carpocapsae]|uniref:Uncharacterized protein n=1 Tax=Steinernema carpocapsae TaxID=34508 RepID=A0A4V6A6K1_STECR|nr:hypothetical protein L596_009422 [Steinernema carpocapsae]